jgi:hypothetical protein
MDLRKMEHKIDDYFRERLFDYTVEAPESSWQAIDNRLKEKKTRMWWTIGISLAASIALIISLGIGFFLGSNYHSRVAIDTKIKKLPESSVSSSKTLNRSTIKSNFSSSSKDLTTSKEQISNKSSNSSENIHLAGISIENSKHKMYDFNEVQDLNSNANIDVLLPLQSKEIILESKSQQYNLAISQSFSDAMLGINNDGLAEENLENVSQSKYNWQLGGNAAPLYTYRNIGNNSTGNSTSTFNKNEVALLSYAAGLTLNIEKKRWKIETGVYYTKMGQKINDVYVNEYALINKPNEVTLGDIKQNNIGIVASENFAATNTNAISSISNSNGVIVAQSNTINQNKDFTQNSVTSNKFTPVQYEITTTQASLEQNYSYIELPVVAHYKVVDRKVDLSLSGGMSANILVGNKVYLESNSNKTLVGETGNTQTLNYAGVFGMTVEVPLASRWDFVLEPRFRYYLNSLNKSQNISTHPYSMGIHSGVNFRF